MRESVIINLSLFSRSFHFPLVPSSQGSIQLSYSRIWIRSPRRCPPTHTHTHLHNQPRCFVRLTPMLIETPRSKACRRSAVVVMMEKTKKEDRLGYAPEKTQLYEGNTQNRHWWRADAAERDVPMQGHASRFERVSSPKLKQYNKIKKISVPTSWQSAVMPTLWEVLTHLPWDLTVKVVMRSGGIISWK